ncbi:uncharacterized protein V6R79_022979 [Siganus canaliculatus]
MWACCSSPTNPPVFESGRSDANETLQEDHLSTRERAERQKEAEQEAAAATERLSSLRREELRISDFIASPLFKIPKASGCCFTHGIIKPKASPLPRRHAPEPISCSRGVLLVMPSAGAHARTPCQRD